LHHFGLEPPPRGRILQRTYRSDKLVHDALTGETRAASKAILFLLTPDSFFRVPPTPLRRSLALLRRPDPITLHLLADNGDYSMLRRRARRPQAVVPGGVWQGRRRAAGRGSRCSAARLHRASEFADFELGSREELVAAFCGSPGVNRGVYEGPLSH